MSSSITPGPDRPGNSQPPVGATRVTAEPTRRRRWPLLLLLLLGLIALAFLISRCTNSSNTTGTAAVPATNTSSPSSSTSASTSASSSSASSSSASTSSGSASTSGTSPSSSASAAAAPTTTAPAATAAPAGPAGPAAPAAGAAGTVTSGDTVLVGTAAGSTTTTPAALTSFVGKPATAQLATVQSVPADEGFWVGTSDTNRVWVQLTGAGESPQTVKAGDHITFTGTVVANPAGFPAQVDVDAGEGADQLTSQGAHLETPKTGFTLTK